MEIGIIGLGIVGKATKNGFQSLGHDVSIHDIALDTSIDDVLKTELCFICVPTPSKETGECDVSIVQNVVKDLVDKKYKGIICIKSTVSPGTTLELIYKYEDRGIDICFVPEFLRERCATEDFIDNHDVCIIGTQDGKIYQKVKEAHGHYPENFVQLIETEAEFCKYFNNSYNSTLITFANSFYELCESKGVNYNRIKEAISHRRTINDFYLDCNENLRGFGGMCLPKDTKELAHLSKKLMTDVEFFEDILKENEKYKTTVFKNMRKG